jgi:glucosamine-phosphate N-acetyltransferase
MKIKIKLRNIKEEDLKHGFLETLSYLTSIDLSFIKAKAILKRRKTKGYITKVACAGKAIIGSASLFIEEKFIHSGGKVGYIEEVVVHPDYRGSNIGVDLINELLGLAKKYGCYKVILHCAWRNIEYYEKLGFKYNEASMRYEIH